MKKEELKNSRQFKDAMARQKRLGPEKFEYTTVPLTWCVRFDLSPVQLLTYCIIRDRTLNYEEHAYTGSIKGLCAILNVSIPTVRSALEVLEQKGFIHKDMRKRLRSDGERTWVTYVSHTNLTAGGRTIEESLEIFSDINIRRKSGYR